MDNRWRVAAVLCAFLLHGEMVAAQEQSYGEAEYLNSCAACHGFYGRGDGALAEVLMKRPADLTALKKENGGEFPYYRVFAVIDGRSVVASHGVREMPVWGRQFLEDDSKTYGPIGGEAVTQERIHALTEYIATLQRCPRSALLETVDMSRSRAWLTRPSRRPSCRSERVPHSFEHVRHRRDWRLPR